ncbi:MAG: HAD family hydrolase, partial [Thiomicrorhabdus sp.]|nr:HAD family hydrolase [Thiomicrorhabdus sp.]
MRLLLCTDMDRTIIPNGPQKEAAGARETFGRFCHQPEVCLVYVTGRHLALMQQAIGEYQLPQSGYAITDVGTRIYQHKEHIWHPIAAWEAEIDQDWQIDGVTLKTEQIYGLLNTVPGLSMQELEKQNAHKISFYVDLQKWNEQACLKEVKAR